MDVLNRITKNTALNGMPTWHKAIALLVFSAIVTLLFVMLTLLLINGPHVVIRFGY